MRQQWSATVWAEMMADGYGMYAAENAYGRKALCFHSPISNERHEVHGLQAVRDWTTRTTWSAFSGAIEVAVREGTVATATVVRSDQLRFRVALLANV